MSLPDLIRYVGTPAGRPAWDEAITNCNLPMRARMRLAATLVEASEIQLEVGPRIPIRTEYEMPMQAFMDGRLRTDMPALKGVHARRMVVHMLRQGREAFVQSRGLKRHEM